MTDTPASASFPYHPPKGTRVPGSGRAKGTPNHPLSRAGLRRLARPLLRSAQWQLDVTLDGVPDERRVRCRAILAAFAEHLVDGLAAEAIAARKRGRGRELYKSARALACRTKGQPS